MIRTVIDTFKEAIETNLRKVDGSSVKVSYVNLEKRKDTLVPDAINLFLFTSRERRDLRTASNWQIPTQKDQRGVSTSSALPITLDLLVIFNLGGKDNYEKALDCYAQVLAYFYKQNSLEAKFEGFNTTVNVLSTGFDTLNEIEIRNSLNIPGTPILRYDLKFALVRGKVEALPVLRSVPTQTGPVEGPKATLPPVAEYLVKAPVGRTLNAIQDQIKNLLQEPSPQPRNEDLLIPLKKAYNNGITRLLSIATHAGKSYQFAIQRNREQYDHFLLELPEFARELTPALRQLLKTQSQALKTRFQYFVTDLEIAEEYLPSLELPMQEIKLLNQLGVSLYSSSQRLFAKNLKPVNGLNEEDFIKKWWELQQGVEQLQDTYLSLRKNALKTAPTGPAGPIKAFLKGAAAQLTAPLERTRKQNKIYNRLCGGEKPLTRMALREYKHIYEALHRAMNNYENQLINTIYNQKLQTFFTQITQLESLNK